MTDDLARKKARTAVADAIATATSPDPHVIAADLTAGLPSAMLRPLLALALPTFIRTSMTTGRSFALPTLSAPSQERCDTQDAPARGGKSWRKNARDIWQTYLAQPIEVGGGTREWKHLGQCTVADLKHAIAVRRHLAEANMQAASQLEAVLDLMLEHGVSTADQLPAHLGSALMGHAA